MSKSNRKTLQLYRNLLERAMWAIAETDDEDLRADIEEALKKRELDFPMYTDPCAFGHE